ncbi:fluoride efflux transporter FluC [Futiania mangrovi]|uniref:Fluoride-specific ion channel FluC n=1 Tax=Futiania mangrovi TaxID=2959716 RepID=A0A9J6PG28_9PROT|nr:CrcB family protein [Futiania mangrovii]MCP1337681.1 CrcB family protein [Futiania mangrovii]
MDGALARHGAIAAGAALGAVARAGLGAALGGGLLAGTLAANVLGSVAIGLFAGLTVPGGRYEPSPVARQFVITGLCGGFTTFSIFSLEALEMLISGRAGLAAGAVALSVALWLGGVWAGFRLGKGLSGRPPAGA